MMIDKELIVTLHPPLYSIFTFPISVYPLLFLVCPLIITIAYSQSFFVIVLTYLHFLAKLR